MTDMFLMSLAGGVLVSILAEILKKYIKPKFGDLGVQAFVLLLSFVLGAGVYFYNRLPAETLAIIGQIFVSAIALYDILTRRVVVQLGKWQAGK